MRKIEYEPYDNAFLKYNIRVISPVDHRLEYGLFPIVGNDRRKNVIVGKLNNEKFEFVKF